MGGFGFEACGELGELEGVVFRQFQYGGGLAQGAGEHDDCGGVDPVLVGGGVHGEIATVRGDVSGMRGVTYPNGSATWKTVYERHRLWSTDGTWERLLQQVQAETDAAGEIDWDISADTPRSCGHTSTPQAGASGMKKPDKTAI